VSETGIIECTNIMFGGTCGCELCDMRYKYIHLKNIVPKDIQTAHEEWKSGNKDNADLWAPNIQKWYKETQ